MSIFDARKAALDMAMRHHGPQTALDTIFQTADQFVEYLNEGRQKKQPAKFQFSPAMIADFYGVAGDPLVFLSRLKLASLDAGIVHFEPYGFQEDFVRFIHEEKRSHVTHARQMGISTCLAAYILWTSMYGDRGDCLSLVVSRSLSSSIEILDRVRFMYENLPEHLRVPMLTNNKGMIEFENHNRILARAVSPTVGRGLAIKNLFVDQAQWIPHGVGREFWENHYPCLAGLSRIVMTSSAGDTDGIFYDIGCGAPENGFATMTLPWDRHPGRDEDWKTMTQDQLGERAFKREFECQFVTQPRIARSDRPAPSV